MKKPSAANGSTKSLSRISEGRGQITVRFVLERDLNDASNDVREKVASAVRNMRRASSQRSTGRRSRAAHRVLVRGCHEPAHADRAERQAHCARDSQTVNGVGEVSLAAAGRARFQILVVDIEKPWAVHDEGARRAIVAENVEISGRNGRAGQGSGRAAHARPRRRVERLQRDCRCDEESGTPIRIAHSGERDHAVRGVVGKTPRSCSAYGERWARTPSWSRARAGDD